MSYIIDPIPQSPAAAGPGRPIIANDGLRRASLLSSPIPHFSDPPSPGTSPLQSHPFARCNPFRQHCCPMPLWVGFLVPCLFVMGVHCCLAWITFSQATLPSIETVSNRLFDISAAHVQHSMGSFFQGISTLAVVLTVFAETNPTQTQMQDFLIKLVGRQTGPMRIGFAFANGALMLARRLESGELQGVIRPACNETLLGSLCINATSIWRVDNDSLVEPALISASERGGLPLYITLNPLSTTRPCINVSDGMVVILPLVGSAKGGVAIIEYPISALAMLLQSLQKELRTTAPALLVNRNGAVFASSPFTDLNNNDLLMLQDVATRQDEIYRIRLDGFGDSDVIRASLGGTRYFQSLGEWADNMDVQILVVFSRSDFHRLDRLWALHIGLGLGFLAFLGLVWGISYRVLLRMPIQGLVQRLLSLKDTFLVRPLEAQDNRKTSIFREFVQLQNRVFESIRMAELAAEQRASELNQAIEAEKEAQKHSQNLMRSKETYYAMMSHELRSPLAAILGMSELLGKTRLDDQQKECNDAMMFAATNMMSIVNNLLDFSKLEAEKMVLETIPFSPRECVEKVCNQLELAAEDKNIELIVDIDCHLPETISGDPLRVNQVLLNLLNNAIKFTAGGCIWLRCYLNTVTTAIYFEVEDSGIGLSAAALGRLFEPFVLADATVSRKYGGTGLGLVWRLVITSLKNFCIF